MLEHYTQGTLPELASADLEALLARETASAVVIRDQAAPYVLCGACGVPNALPPLPGMSWTIRSPGDVAARLQVEMGCLEREELRVLTLTAKNRVLAMHTVYQGNVSASLVRVGELFRDAVRSDASGVILVHNHPSGDPTPSTDDLHLTAETIAAGRLLDVDVLDHIVVARDGWISLRDRGVTFDRLVR